MNLIRSTVIASCSGRQRNFIPNHSRYRPRLSDFTSVKRNLVFFSISGEIPKIRYSGDVIFLYSWEMSEKLGQPRVSGLRIKSSQKVRNTGMHVRSWSNRTRSRPIPTHMWKFWRSILMQKAISEFFRVSLPGRG